MAQHIHRCRRSERSASTPSRSPGAPRQRCDTRTPNAHSYDTLAHRSPRPLPQAQPQPQEPRLWHRGRNTSHSHAPCLRCLRDAATVTAAGVYIAHIIRDRLGLRAAPGGGESREGSHPRTGTTGPAGGARRTITVGDTAACADVKTQRYVTRPLHLCHAGPLSPFQRHWLRLQLRCSSHTAR